MDEVRLMRSSDAADCRRLWEACFPDSDSFNDWFFQNRFLPRWGVCLLHDGTLASAVYSLPIHVRVRNVLLPASMLAGVSTFPEYSGRGYMKQVFTRYMQEVRGANIPLAVHTPAHLPTFFSRGHFPVSSTLHMTADLTKPMPFPSGLQQLSPEEALALTDAFQHCYGRATGEYSGMVSRSYADMRFKLQDYSADSALFLVDWQADTVQGYAVYYNTPENGLHAEEIVSVTAAGYERLLHGLYAKAEGARLHCKLPPDAPRTVLPGAVYETRPQGVAGAADIGALLSAIINSEDYRFAVNDRTVPQNEGVWNGEGSRTVLPAQITADAGHLLQFLFGYRALSELADAGEAIIHDAAAAAELDERFPKQSCFIIDEY